MGRLILCFIAGSWLLTAASFGADSTVILSDLEAQATTEAAEAGKVAPASNEVVTDYSPYRMAEESNRLILALRVSIGRGSPESMEALEEMASTWVFLELNSIKA